jgi:hypothetical protein
VIPFDYSKWEDSMSKTFEFDDGHSSSPWDTRTGNVTGWTRSDFVYVLQAYSKAKGPRQAASIIQQFCGMADPTLVPSYMFGRVIAVMTQQITGRDERDYAAAYNSDILGRVGRCGRTLHLTDGRHRLTALKPPKEDA